MMTLRGAPALILMLGWTLLVPHPAQGQKASSPDTPEKTISRYIQALREGSLEGVRAVSYLPDAAFYLPAPVNILRYEIRGKKILRAEDLEGLDLRLPPKAGDIQLDILQVRQAEGQRTYHMFSYWLRPSGDGWKIYDRSIWGGP